MEQENNIPLFDQAFAMVILAHYEPASTLTDSTTQFSSMEICHLIKQVYGADNFSQADIFPRMKQAGYTTYDAGNVQLWLLKQRVL